jgi:hypothetical protein
VQYRTTSLLAVLLVLVLATANASCGVLEGVSSREQHVLDDVSRRVPAGERVDCSEVPLVPYGGTHIRYSRRTRVHPAFQTRLERFEEVAVEVATRVYGRPPDRLMHYGGFSCRRVRGRAERMSEHALGNALDVAGFRFPRLARDAEVPEGLPNALRRGFEIDVGRDFLPARDSEVARRHAEFFRELMRELEHRDDVFRGMIGPPARGHRNHLHLDTGRWRYQRYRLPVL